MRFSSLTKLISTWNGARMQTWLGTASYQVSLPFLTAFISTLPHKNHQNTYNLSIGFLRAMESCQSILFLTTNRVGSFDDAFVSRIHVSLYYRDFTQDDRRKVWTVFFNKLAKDRKNAMHVPVETILYTTGPEVANLKWNGREIRNGEWPLQPTLSEKIREEGRRKADSRHDTAFQTAVALADFDDDRNEDGKVVLRESHIQQIVHMSQEFKQYLRELHRGDEAKRADRQRIRFDEFDQKG